MPVIKNRIIFHVDMDAFFASVEIVKNPSLRGKPVIVGGNPKGRGVVSTCSYEARKFGIHSAMSLFEAKRRCPGAVFIEGSYSLYRDYSDEVMNILRSFSKEIEIVSIDEAYLDATDLPANFDSAFKMAQVLRKTVYEDTLLTCSVGIGSNKLIAKIASSLAKPNGLLEVPTGKEVEFLAPLPVEKIPGIGSKTKEFLNSEGIKLVKDFQMLGLDRLVQRYGASGYYFYMVSIGKDNRPVKSSDDPPKSIGAETTFEVDQTDLKYLISSLVGLFEKAYQRMRRHHMRARGISIKLRFADFHTITRSCTLNAHINDHETLLENLLRLFHQSYTNGKPLRLIGVSLEKLTDKYWQPTFWDWQREQI
jgi:DNA polymerase IV